MAEKRGGKKRKDAVTIPDTAITLAGTKIRHEIDEKEYPSMEVSQLTKPDF